MHRDTKLQAANGRKRGKARVQPSFLWTDGKRGECEAKKRYRYTRRKQPSKPLVKPLV